MQLDVKPDALIFVTAVDYTNTWSNLVYIERQLQGSFSVEVPSISSVEGKLSICMDVRHEQSEKRDWGPSSKELEVVNDPGSSDGKQPKHTGSMVAHIVVARPAVDQVIFTRGLRGRKRLFKGFQKLVGEAEPEDLDEGPKPGGANASSTSLLLEGVGEPPQQVCSAISPSNRRECSDDL